MLDAGSVIYLAVEFRNGPRNKYLIVLDVDTHVHTFTINKAINSFFGSGEFGKCYADIDAESHPFLDYNSFVDCNEVVRLDLADTIAELRTDPDCLKGEISNEVRESIIDKINRTPGLSPVEKERYVHCLAG